MCVCNLHFVVCLNMHRFFILKINFSPYSLRPPIFYSLLSFSFAQGGDISGNGFLENVILFFNAIFFKGQRLVTQTLTGFVFIIWFQMRSIFCLAV